MPGTDISFLDVMAGLALAFFWIQALLIAAGSFKELGALRKEFRGLVGKGLRRGTVVRGEGPGGLFAEHQTIQRGKSKGDGLIHFHDRDFQSALFGGTVKLDDDEEIRVPEGGEFWPARDKQVAAGNKCNAATFESAYDMARKAKGWMRTVKTGVSVEDEVWIGSGDTPFVTATDPRAWMSRRTWSVIGLMTIHLLVAAGCTAAAVWPPLFGTVSTIGALACFLWFMQAQDFTRVVGEWVRPPARAFLRGTWRTP